MSGLRRRMFSILKFGQLQQWGFESLAYKNIAYIQDNSTSVHSRLSDTFNIFDERVMLFAERQELRWFIALTNQVP